MTKKVNTLKASSFDMNIDNGIATVKRTFTFDKANIEYNIAIPFKGEAETLTVVEIHQRTVTQVIELLQGLLPPEK